MLNYREFIANSRYGVVITCTPPSKCLGLPKERKHVPVNFGATDRINFLFMEHSDIRILSLQIPSAVTCGLEVPSRCKILVSGALNLSEYINSIFNGICWLIVSM